MILKGSQRGNGADLATHLMNSFDNERIEIAEVYGTVAGDLHGAFAEFEAVSLGTKAKEYLYSLSISPSAPLTREQYNEAIAAIENRLGLTDQPRAVVFHVKDGREHCHVVWSRIDVDKMRAIHMAHDHRKLMDLACELARKYGHDLPPGLKAWEEKQKREKEKLEATLGEKAQAEETGITPEQRREEITAAYEASDSAEAFRSALEQKGYVLARGDRRGLVVVDSFGGVHSLTRYIKGHSAKEIKAKLAALAPGAAAERRSGEGDHAAAGAGAGGARARAAAGTGAREGPGTGARAPCGVPPAEGGGARRKAGRAPAGSAAGRAAAFHPAAGGTARAACRPEKREQGVPVPGPQRRRRPDPAHAGPALGALRTFRKRRISIRRSGTAWRTRRSPAAMRGRSATSSGAGGRSPGLRRGKGNR